MQTLSDIRELKKWLELDPGNTSEDLKLLFLLEQASDWIAELLNRPGLFWASRTEYYNGTGTQKLLLRSRPVYTSPTIQVWVDEAGFWGAASGAYTTTGSALTWGDDFALDIDNDDGTSRSGILVRLHNFWPRASVRQRGLLAPFIGEGYGCIKITYTAGYTADTMPSRLRMATNFLVAKMRHIIALGGVEVGSESFESRHISYIIPQKDYLLGMIRPMIWSLRNQQW